MLERVGHNRTAIYLITIATRVSLKIDVKLYARWQNIYCLDK